MTNPFPIKTLKHLITPVVFKELSTDDLLTGFKLGKIKQHLYQIGDAYRLWIIQR